MYLYVTHQSFCLFKESDLCKSRGDFRSVELWVLLHMGGAKREAKSLCEGHRSGSQRKGKEVSLWVGKLEEGNFYPRQDCGRGKVVFYLFVSLRQIEFLFVALSLRPFNSGTSVKFFIGFLYMLCSVSCSNIEVRVTQQSYFRMFICVIFTLF